MIGFSEGRKQRGTRYLGNPEFWSRVQVSGDDECWPWTGAKQGHGYGVFRAPNGQRTTASRVAFMLTRGPLPARSVVCHTCDNPPCVNPLHLFEGSQADNVADMDRKGRGCRPGASVPGEANGQAKLTEGEVREILSRPDATPTQLAARFGVSRRLVRLIRSGARWSHLHRQEAA